MKQVHERSCPCKVTPISPYGLNHSFGLPFSRPTRLTQTVPYHYFHHDHQGAMCKCFVAQGNPHYPEPVVLKLAIENGPREAERDLNRELSVLHNLSHPNLTALLGSGQTPKGKT